MDHVKKKNLIGQKFERLTVISEETTISYKDNRAHWNCKCECGNMIIVSTNHLTSGNTKSCGCLKIETTKKNQKISLTSITKYEPYIATARRLWKSYCYRDKNCDIIFDDWLIISQQNCYYCGVVPSNEYNCFTKKIEASQYARDNGNFTYNGLDRINNSLSYTLDNIAACCWTCNRAKNERPIEEFYLYINKLKINTFIVPKYLHMLPSNYLLSSIKGTYRHYKKNYEIMDIDLQTFYTYSQLPCHFCNTEKSNYFNVYLKDKKASQAAKDGAHFYYNGIDRLDNNMPHNIENIVPCCYWCNFAKSKLTLSDFQAWIRRIQNYQKNKINKLSNS